VVAEELGIIGVIAVLGGFLALAYGGVQVALAASQPFHRLLAGGIVGWFMVQALINVGGVTGLLPVTGLTLPFISAGGSSLFVTLVATGILLNLARNDR
jgi:cell division protein FtsW